jgi:hypothetical protein
MYVTHSPSVTMKVLCHKVKYANYTSRLHEAHFSRVSNEMINYVVSRAYFTKYQTRSGAQSANILLDHSSNLDQFLHRFFKFRSLQEVVYIYWEIKKFSRFFAFVFSTYMDTSWTFMLVLTWWDISMVECQSWRNHNYLWHSFETDNLWVV